MYDCSSVSGPCCGGGTVARDSSGLSVWTAFGVIWSEVIEWDKEGLELVLAPSIDRGDLS